MESKENEYRELINETIKNRGHFVEKYIKKNVEFYNFIISETSFLENPKFFVERIYCVHNKITFMHLCVNCNNTVNFSGKINRGYPKTCSHSCSAKNSTQKRKETNLSKHGDENFNNREQFKLTCQEKFGTDSPLQNEEIKQKIKETN